LDFSLVTVLFLTPFRSSPPKSDPRCETLIAHGHRRAVDILLSTTTTDVAHRVGIVLEVTIVNAPHKHFAATITTGMVTDDAHLPVPASKTILLQDAHMMTPTTQDHHRRRRRLAITTTLILLGDRMADRAVRHAVIMQPMSVVHTGSGLVLSFFLAYI
jgi:hypothetical protein